MNHFFTILAYTEAPVTPRIKAERWTTDPSCAGAAQP